jgi:hypothetical protein
MSTETSKSGQAVGGIVVLIIFLIIFGPGMVWGGFVQYDEMTRFQQEGGRKEMHWFAALLYNCFGPAGVAIPFWIIGGIVSALDVCLVIWLPARWLKKMRAGNYTSGRADRLLRTLDTNKPSQDA